MAWPSIYDNQTALGPTRSLQELMLRMPKGINQMSNRTVQFAATFIALASFSVPAGAQASAPGQAAPAAYPAYVYAQAAPTPPYAAPPVYSSGAGSVQQFGYFTAPGYGPPTQPGLSTEPPTASQAAPAPTQADRGTTAGQPTNLARRLPPLAFAARFGAVVAGAGSDQASCDGDCGGFAGSSTDYADRSAFSVGLDVLGQIGSLVRLGGTISAVTSSEIEVKGVPSAYKLGSDLSFDFVVELTPKIGGNVWLTPRAELGLTSLYPGADLAADQNKSRAACESEGLSGCGDITGAHQGFNAGLGAGVLYAAGEHVRLRADLLYQAYVLNMQSLELTSGGSTTKISEDLVGARLIATVGVEF